MHGFGPVEIEVDEPVFHEPWEGRTFALMIATAAAGLRSGSVRPGIEEIDPATYLACSYYERWARSVEAGLIRASTLTAEDIDTRAASGDPPRDHADDTDPDVVRGLVAALVGPRRPSGDEVPMRYSVGDRVTVKRMAPLGHHRCPRYVRGVTGTVMRTPGGWPHASSGEPPEATYTVRFSMDDLWGGDAEPGWLYVDLWERYLE
jgi:nitrile hydratase